MRACLSVCQSVRRSVGLAWDEGRDAADKLGEDLGGHERACACGWLVCVLIVLSSGDVGRGDCCGWLLCVLIV